MDEWVRKHPPSPLDPEYSARAMAAARERALAPSPQGLSHAELERQVRQEFSAHLANELMALARPAIGLWPQQPSADASPTASRFGGMPVVRRAGPGLAAQASHSSFWRSSIARISHTSRPRRRCRTRACSHSLATTIGSMAACRASRPRQPSSIGPPWFR